jgi:hypothetical protein
VSQRISGYPRQPLEHYATPPWCVQIVARHLREQCKSIWAPADSEASPLVQILRAEGFDVVASCTPFLAHRTPPHDRVDGIITNPPFGRGGQLASQFIAHAIALAPIVAMLLRIDFDSAKTREHLFRDCRAFAHKIVLLDRVVWFEREGAAGPSENHCWMLWNARHRGPPTISYARRPS